MGRILFHNIECWDLVRTRTAALDAYKGNPLVEEMISFIKSETSRSLTISSKD